LTNITKLTSDTFRFWITRKKIRDDSSCVIDLTGLTFSSPGGLVPLAALCSSLAKNHPRIIIKLAHPHQRNYFVSSGFYSVLEDIVVFEPEIPKARLGDFEDRRGGNPLMIEITRIGDEKDLPQLLNKLVSILRFRMSLGKEHAFDTAIAVSELCQNTFDHNPEACGLIGLQVFNASNGRFVEVSISDYGRGIAATLRENSDNPSFLTDMEAIETAVLLGTSQYRDVTRGTGLYHLLKIAKKGDGTVQLCSGTATKRFRTDLGKVHGFVETNSLSGTHITLSLKART